MRGNLLQPIPMFPVRFGDAGITIFAKIRSNVGLIAFNCARGISWSPHPKRSRADSLTEVAW
jgi:hypothetical protein